MIDAIIDDAIATLATVVVLIGVLVIPAAGYEIWRTRRDREWLRRLHGLQRARKEMGNDDKSKIMAGR